MKHETSKGAIDIGPAVNRFLYGGFVLFAAYYAFRMEWGDSFSMFAIAAIFDPFNQSQPFRERPFYQKVWLYVHVAIILLLAGLWLAQKFH